MADAAPQFRVFINYRRNDSGGYAGRIYDALRAHSSEWDVFMDIDAIDPGADFTEVIDESLETCDVVVAVIGRQWLQTSDERGRRRLEHPDDFVRLELLAALDRNVRVIPVLVQGAAMPSSEELPEELARLARRQGLELSDGRWRYDVGRLIEVLEGYYGRATGASVAAARPVPEEPRVEPRPHEEPPPAAPVRAPARPPVHPSARPVAPAWATAVAGVAAVFIANFVSLSPDGDTLLRSDYAPFRSTVWFSIELLAVPILASLALLGCAKQRIHGEQAVGILLGFGLATAAAGIGLAGSHSARTPAPWLVLVGGLLMLAGGVPGLRRVRRSTAPAEPDAPVGVLPQLLVVAGAVLCVVATLADLYPYYRLLTGPQGFWVALEPLVGGAVAAVSLIAAQSAGRRALTSGLQLAIGLQLSLFYLAYLGQFAAGLRPREAAFLGVAGGVAVAVGGRVAWRRLGGEQPDVVSAAATP